jgi:ribonuclease P protein component
VDTPLPQPRSILRLKRPGDFRRIYDVGNKSVGRCMILWVAPSTGPIPKIGVVASKRSIGNAVQRNRAKRRLREVTRLLADLLPAGVDVVLVSRATVLTIPWDDLLTDFTRCTARFDPAEYATPSSNPS